MPGFDMSDYVPVNERIAAFLDKHPDGCLQSEIVELTADRVTVRAYAYRSPDDPRPGIGHSSLEIPGKTTFTRGSEIENAETSAWGRAIAALGFEVKRGLASAEEVRNKQPEQRRGGTPSSPSAAAPASPVKEAEALRMELMALTADKGHEYQMMLADKVGVPKGQRATVEQLREMIVLAIDTTALDTSAAARAADQDGTPLPSEELSDAGAVPSPGAPPELQERIERARAKGKKADEPVQESLLGEPVA